MVSNETCIIAEIGQNHCGDMYLAQRLIYRAKENGANLAKFQLYEHAKFYKNSNIPNVELSFEQAKMLFEYGKEVGIEVFFSVFDLERIKWCQDIGVRRYKFAFSQRYSDLIYAVPRDSEVIISSDRPMRYGGKTLYCIPDYPAHLAQFKFNWAFPDKFDGLSDHTIGLDAAKIAIARGASIIEKHFCVTHDTGIDAKWSMTPDELRELRRWATQVQICT